MKGIQDNGRPLLKWSTGHHGTGSEQRVLTPLSCLSPLSSARFLLVPAGALGSLGLGDLYIVLYCDFQNVLSYSFLYIVIKIEFLIIESHSVKLSLKNVNFFL